MLIFSEGSAFVIAVAIRTDKINNSTDSNRMDNKHKHPKRMGMEVSNNMAIMDKTCIKWAMVSKEVTPPLNRTIISSTA